MTYSRRCSLIRMQGQLPLSVQGYAELGGVQFVSGNFFESLGINPAVGRLIQTNAMTGADAPSVAVLSYNYWRDRLAADRNVVGRTIRVGRVPFTICGVAAPEFFGVGPGAAPRLYTPAGPGFRVTADTIATRDEKMSMFSDAHYLGRHDGTASPGITIAQAEAKRNAIPPIRDRRRRERESRRSCRRCGWTKAVRASIRCAVVFEAALRFDVYGRIHSRDRLREYREPAPGACRRETARNGRATQSRSRPSAHYTAITHGELAPRSAWRLAWCRRRRGRNSVSPLVDVRGQRRFSTSRDARLARTCIHPVQLQWVRESCSDWRRPSKPRASRSLRP